MKMAAMKLLPLAALSLALLQGSAAADTLRLDKKGLSLVDAQGRELDRLALRAKRWDQRPGVAVLLDADRGRPSLPANSSRASTPTCSEADIVDYLRPHASRDSI